MDMVQREREREEKTVVSRYTMRNNIFFVISVAALGSEQFPEILVKKKVK